jgi:pyruvate ferredoxin oxidoreductase beta subunit
MKDLPSTHLLGAGTAMCAGCGGLEALHEACDVLGQKTVFINAAGCMTLLASYPFTPFRGSWLYTSMASAPAGAQGVRDALDILRTKGRIAAEEDLAAVVLTGDGAAYGMGLSATRRVTQSDFSHICYDNGATATPAGNIRRAPRCADADPGLRGQRGGRIFAMDRAASYAPP